MYGFPAWNNKVGFTAAQGALNLLESVIYCFYMYVVGKEIVDWSYAGIKTLEVRGKAVSLAVLLCFSGAVMTVSKTLLYCKLLFTLYWCTGTLTSAGLNEYFSNFENIGHNSLFNIIMLWIIPNGAWIVMPGYMIYVLGKEILESMSATGNGKKTR
jgi:hypothetical protein